MPGVPIGLRRLPHCPPGYTPEYKTRGAAGADICAAIDKPMMLRPAARLPIPTGLTVEIPEGYQIELRPRSGLALKEGITIVNTPATIDSDFRGEIIVIVLNTGTSYFVVEPGMRIAQMVVMPAFQAIWVPMTELSETERGTGGFGSTGVS
jgi:dUTP pyrophosphatase